MTVPDSVGRCPECGGVLTIDETAETEEQVVRQAPGRMPYVETVRRPCVIAACSACEFCIELRPEVKR